MVATSATLAPPVESRVERRRARTRAFGVSTSWTALVAVVGVAIVVARSPSTIFNPQLYAEDGGVWFANAYNSGPFRPLLWSHTGYLQTFPRLVADAGLLVPFKELPLLFVFVAVAIQVLPACFLVSRRMARLMPSVYVRATFAVIYLVLPNSKEINANLTNAQWHLALLAFLVVIADPGGRSWKVFDIVVITMSALTGPFALVLAPIALIVYLARRERWSGIVTVVLTNLAVLQIIELATSQRYTRPLAPLGVSAPRLMEILGGQVMGGTLIGPPVTAAGNLPALPWLCALLVIVGATFVAMAIWRGPLELGLLNVFAGVTLLSALASPVISVTGFQWQRLTTDVGARYWFLPTCALVADVIWSCGNLYRRNPRGAVIPFVCLACLLGIGVRTSFEYPALNPRPNWAAESATFAGLKSGAKHTFTEIPAGFYFTVTKH